jgi:hypothetical protein
MRISCYQLSVSFCKVWLTLSLVLPACNNSSKALHTHNSGATKHRITYPIRRLNVIHLLSFVPGRFGCIALHVHSTTVAKQLHSSPTVPRTLGSGTQPTISLVEFIDKNCSREW